MHPGTVFSWLINVHARGLGILSSRNHRASP